MQDSTENEEGNDYNRTMPWSDEELIKCGKYKLVYGIITGEMMVYLPAKKGPVPYKELYKLKVEVKPPKKIRQSLFGERSKY